MADGFITSDSSGVTVTRCSMVPVVLDASVRLALVAAYFLGAIQLLPYLSLNLLLAVGVTAVSAFSPRRALWTEPLAEARPLALLNNSLRLLSWFLVAVPSSVLLALVTTVIIPPNPMGEGKLFCGMFLFLPTAFLAYKYVKGPLRSFQFRPARLGLRALEAGLPEVQPHLLYLLTFATPRDQNLPLSLNGVYWSELLGGSPNAVATWFVRIGLLRTRTERHHNPRGDAGDRTVEELRALLRKHGLPVSGRKAELVARLATRDPAFAREPRVVEETFLEWTESGARLAASHVTRLAKLAPGSGGQLSALGFQNPVFVRVLRQVLLWLLTAAAGGVVGNRVDAEVVELVHDLKDKLLETKEQLDGEAPDLLEVTAGQSAAPTQTELSSSPEAPAGPTAVPYPPAGESEEKQPSERTLSESPQRAHLGVRLPPFAAALAARPVVGDSDRSPFEDLIADIQALLQALPAPAAPGVLQTSASGMAPNSDDGDVLDQMRHQLRDFEQQVHSRGADHDWDDMVG